MSNGANHQLQALTYKQVHLFIDLSIDNNTQRYIFKKDKKNPHT